MRVKVFWLQSGLSSAPRRLASSFLREKTAVSSAPKIYFGSFLKQLAIRLGLTHHRCMNAYSEDLRKKVVEAKECGMPTVEVARTFGMGISSVKRYAKTAREGSSLRPKKSPGRPPKADERARRLLEADLQERPAATLSERREYLSSVAGLRVSESTVSRLLRRMGWSRKKDRWVRQNATSS